MRMGSVSTDQITITQPTALAVQTNASDALCSGSANGSAGVNVAGGTTPYSMPGLHREVPVWLPITLLQVFILQQLHHKWMYTDRIINSRSIIAITTSMVHTNASCHGAADGTASVYTGGGASGFSYSGFPAGGSGSSATNLAAGSYQVTVTDANGCTRSASVTITEPASMTIQNSSTPATCGSSNGSASVVPAGGSAPYSYAWNPGGETLQP